MRASFLKAPPRLSIVIQEKLDRHLSVQFGIQRSIHDAHAAFAKQIDDFVRPKFLAGLQWQADGGALSQGSPSRLIQQRPFLRQEALDLIS